jgi:quercetin 2,3-dioxygenase
MVDQLRAGDFYVFSAGSGGKHSELSISDEDMNAVYIWLMPGRLYLPPTYHRAHFDFRRRRNRIEQLVGDADGALPVPQDFRVSRLISDGGQSYSYTPRTPEYGVYVFMLEGAASCQGTALARRDSFGFWGAEAVQIEAEADATDVLILETAMVDDANIKAWEKTHARH